MLPSARRLPSALTLFGSVYHQAPAKSLRLGRGDQNRTSYAKHTRKRSSPVMADSGKLYYTPSRNVPPNIIGSNHSLPLKMDQPRLDRLTMLKGSLQDLAEGGMFTMHQRPAIVALMVRLRQLTPRLGIVIENKHTIVWGLGEDERGSQSGTAPRSKDIFVHLACARSAVTRVPQSLAHPWPATHSSECNIGVRVWIL